MSVVDRGSPSALGRGLAALIPPRAAPAGGVTELPVEAIRPNRYQPRRRVAADALGELAASIAEHGVIQPVLVTRTDDGYELIAGERRLRAARLAGLERVPAVIREAADRDRLELALVENIQRADLDPLEEARAYRQLIEEFGLTQEEVAARVGRARPSIANALRLLALPAEVQETIAEGDISAGHARAVASLDEPALQIELSRLVVARGLSVRQTEELARRLKERPAARLGGRDVPPARDPDVERLEADLRGALGTKVTVTTGARTGRIVIEYYDQEDLLRLIDRLVGDPA